MKKLACKDLDPNINCDFEATGDDEKEVVNKMMTHIKSHHPDKMKGMGDSEMRSMLKSKVHG